MIPEPARWIIRPMLVMDGLRSVRRDHEIGQASTLPNLPAAITALRTSLNTSSGGDLSELEAISMICSSSFGASSERYVQFEFKSLADRRALAILFAIRLFQADRHGAFPRSLNELTPLYLKALPPDPMRADGGTFGYQPDANPPVLYSVGLDGKDNGASTRPTRVWWRGPMARWNGADVVYPLISVEAQDHE